MMTDYHHLCPYADSSFYLTKLGFNIETVEYKNITFNVWYVFVDQTHNFVTAKISVF